MIDQAIPLDDAEAEVTTAFEREIGVTKVPTTRIDVGNRPFLKFRVGRNAPLYQYALRNAQLSINDDNPFRGAIGLDVDRGEGSFPNSLEASALLTLLTRSTRQVAEGDATGYRVPYIPFQNREDHQLAQPASHIVRGRRGVGKSTLISRAVEILHAANAFTVVLDMQTYSTLSGEELLVEVMHDAARQFASTGGTEAHSKLMKVAEDILGGGLSAARAPVAMKRALKELTDKTKVHAYLFLDDFHLVEQAAQPKLLHHLHGALKGANGWLKVAGLSSLLNVYAPETREGLQVPGDAQFIPLDLTLENPEAAERHLRAILESFLKAIGYSGTSAVMPATTFRRLVWATAGVPRDFLQMFARAVEHAQRNRHSAVTLSDVNSAIGEFGQQKMDDLRRDARNEADKLTNFLNKLETVCLDDKKVNAFLVRSEDSEPRSLIHALSDLRMVHLIHQSITPDRAGERYEAYIIDYSIFTGFRRRPGVREMVPAEGATQFKAAELRALPKIE